MKIKPEDAELASGSGQINPRKAVNPGLIYDLSLSSYASFLCKEGYNSTNIGQLIGGKKKFSCSSMKPAQGIDGLNYPTMHMQLRNGSKINAVFHRTVTNVGPKSVYKATVKSPKGLKVKVSPKVLLFSKPYEKQSFIVRLKGSMKNGTQILSASLEWKDSKHRVKSPILIYKPLQRV